MVEAVEGPARAERPARRYGLTAEAGLAEQIARDLLKDGASQVAPVLQILLAEMWAVATARDAARPRFDRALYADVAAKGLHLDGFLAQQLAALGAWHPPLVASGLALDYLAFYTTPLGAARQRGAAEEADAYPHAPAGLRRRCTDLYLLGDGAPDAAGGAAARLAHDTLAPLVRRRFEESDAPGQHARRVLESRAADWDAGAAGAAGAPLDARALDAVERGAAGMRAWTAAERDLVAASRRERAAAARRRAWLRGGAAAAVLLVAASAAVSFAQWRRSEDRRAESESRELAARSMALGAARRYEALLLAAAAYGRAPTFDARRALFAQLGPEPHLARTLPVFARSVAYTPTGAGSWRSPTTRWPCGTSPPGGGCGRSRSRRTSRRPCGSPPTAARSSGSRRATGRATW